MTLIFQEGFELYNIVSADAKTQIVQVWDNALCDSVPVVAGRTGGLAVTLGGTGTYPSLVPGSMRSYPFANTTSGYAGVGIKTGAAISGEGLFFSVASSDSPQFGLYMNTSGQVELRSGPGTVWATYTTALSVNTWYYFEVSFTISGLGSVVVKMNGTVILSSISTYSTDPAFTGHVNRIKLNGCSHSNPLSFDDIYLCNGSGTFNNGFLGNFQCRIMIPNSIGFSSDGIIVGSDAYNFQAVDEKPYDDDTSYNYLNFPTASDGFDMTNPSIPAGANVIGLNHYFRASAPNEGFIGSIARFERINPPVGPNYGFNLGPLNYVSASYSTLHCLRDSNTVHTSASGVRLTEEDLTLLQLGYKINYS